MSYKARPSTFLNLRLSRSTPLSLRTYGEQQVSMTILQILLVEVVEGAIDERYRAGLFAYIYGSIVREEVGVSRLPADACSTNWTE